MIAASRLLLLILLLSTACSRDADDRAAAPGTATASAAPTVSGARSAAGTPSPQPSPAPSTSPERSDDDEDDLWDDPMEAGFQLAVLVSQHFGPIPMTVNFEVHARNGTPPYSFLWDFGDGSMFETGEAVTHTYTGVGSIHAFVHGRDAVGATYTIEIIMFATTPEEYARQKGPLLRATPATPLPSSPSP